MSMDPRSQERLNTITSKEPSTLNPDEIAFLRARRSYLTKAQLQEYDSVLNPKEAKPPKRETVNKHDNSK